MKIKKPNPIKTFFCVGTEYGEKEKLGLYAEMLGLNKDFKFVLSQHKVANKPEFDSVCTEAEKLLQNDLTRLGEEFYKIPVELKGRLSGTVGSMTIIADNDGKLLTKFHKRDSEGYWDGMTKKYPEKETTGKWKHEIFFILNDEDDE